MPCVRCRGSVLLAVVALAVILENAAAQPTRKSILVGADGVGPSVSVRRRKSAMEGRMEAALRAAFERCFKTYNIDGVFYDLRIPFGENGERTDENGFSHNFHEWGKGEPEALWRRIDSLLLSADFLAYRNAIRADGAKALIFDLPTASWRVSYDPKEIAALRGEYPGTRTRVHVLKSDSVLTSVDIYNYLYCVGSVGMDCSGFVSYALRSLALVASAAASRTQSGPSSRAFGAVTLGSGAETSDEAGLIHSSLWYFTPASGRSEIVEDRVADLRPGDVFIFFGRLGTFRHSAVIQSIDWDAGIVRYFQDTDWAPQEERGVHESVIRFDPAQPLARLGDPSVRWLQRILPTFPGETGLEYWRTDGDRYRTQWPRGRSLVVRLYAIKDLMLSLDPDYYSNRIQIVY